MSSSGWSAPPEKGHRSRAIAQFWLDLMDDETARTADRLEASRLLAERGWGKATLPIAAVEPPNEDDHADDADRWPSPERMRDLAHIYREFGDTDKAPAYEVWADDALAAGASENQPIDPALAPPPTAARVARVLLDQTAEPASLKNCCPLRCPHALSGPVTARLEL